MKISCEVIKDLMILCEDDGCSEDSKRLIELHKKDCKGCTEYYNKLYSIEEMVPEIKEEFNESEVLSKGFKKIKRRWQRFLLTCIVVLPVIVLLTVLGYNEKRGSGICFSNIDDIYKCLRFVRYIESEEFEKAAGMMDFSHEDYYFAENVNHLSREEFEAYMKEKVVKKLEEYNELGITIKDVAYNYAYRIGDEWHVEIVFSEVYPDGSSQRVTPCFSADTLLAGAYRIDPSDRSVYIKEVLSIFIQDDPLNYKELEVDFSLKEGERAVIRWNYIDVDMYTVSSIDLFDVSFGTGYGVDVQDNPKPCRLDTSVPGDYAIVARNLSGEILDIEDALDIEIIKYAEEVE